MKERYQMAVAVHLLLFSREGTAAFLRRAHSGYADGYWSLPAGHVEPAETLVEACVREAREEVGVSLELGQVAFAHVQEKHDFDGEDRIDFFFKCNVDAAEVSNREPHRCDALLWAPISTPPQPLVRYVENALKAIAASTPFGCYVYTPHHA